MVDDIPNFGARVENHENQWFAEQNDGTSPFSMGKPTISMVIFQFANCGCLPEGNILTATHPRKDRQFAGGSESWRLVGRLLVVDDPS